MASGGQGRGVRRDVRWIDPSVTDQYLDEPVGILQPDAELSSWIKQLIQMWNRWRKSDNIKQMLHNCFASAENPYLTALQIMVNCADFYQAKGTSLSCTVMEEFSLWLQNDRQNLKDCLTRELKYEAFIAVHMQRNFKIIKLVYNIYEMAEDKDIFYEEIMKLVSRQQYKEACQIATLLKLHDCFTIEDFIIPLAFQDKMTIAEEFLENSVPHQKNLVIFLDSLLGRRDLQNEIDAVAVKLNIPDVKLDKLYYKPLTKLVARLVKMYNLTTDICPNLIQKRTSGALHFLLHKRYIDNTFGIDSWREMVRETVQDDVSLQEELLVLVNLSNDPEEALYWANYYNIPQSKWPENVKIHFQERDSRSKQEDPEENEENWDDKLIEYHKLSLPYDSIIFVDSDEKLQQFIDSVRHNRRLSKIGIDCEWKPHFVTNKVALSLMQVATDNEVYILDVLKIGLLYKDLWEELGKILFANEHILKLAFSYVGDMNMIKSSLPHLYPYLEENCEILDLSHIWKELMKKYSITFPYTGSENTTGESLARLVEICLGRCLDKSDQFSNWELRPLRRGQLTYAALDAYCLLEVFEVIEKCCIEQDIPFLEVCKHTIHKLKSPKKNIKYTKKIDKKIPESSLACGPPPNPEPIPVCSLRVVCDTMVSGLGFQLRMCGIDTEILKPGENHDTCVKISEKEGRMVITGGKNVYKQISQYLPTGHCYLVSGSNLEDQLKEVVEYFNVKVTKDDVFSRCKICNGATFTKVSRGTMQRLIESHHKLQNRVPIEEVKCEDCAEDDTLCFDSGGLSSEDEAVKELMRPSCYKKVEEQLAEGGVLIRQCRTQSGASIQISIIPEPVLKKQKEYLICDKCGRVYWCGSHLERVLNSTLKGIVRLN